MTSSTNGNQRSENRASTITDKSNPRSLQP
jgi:hypothetical protein